MNDEMDPLPEERILPEPIIINKYKVTKKTVVISILWIIFVAAVVIISLALVGPAIGNFFDQPIDYI